ncbi:hypothetical protein GVAV_000803 [Gurleya vavrai]
MLDQKEIKCSNCATNITPLWRRGANGLHLCNACGLYYKIHNSHRPKELKSDSFKQRQRPKKNEILYQFKAKKAKIENEKLVFEQEKEMIKSKNENTDKEITDNDYDDTLDDNYNNSNKNRKNQIQFINNTKISKDFIYMSRFMNNNRIDEKTTKILQRQQRWLQNSNNYKNPYDNRDIHEQNNIFKDNELTLEELELIAAQVLVSLSKI